MVWGTSSLFTQVTFVPAETIRTGGVKLKLSIFTSTAFVPTSSAFEVTGSDKAATIKMTAETACNSALMVVFSFGVLRAGQRRIHDGERILPLDIVNTRQ